MPLSDEDYIEILRYLQTQLRKYAPDIFEHLGTLQNLPMPPRLRLIQYFHFVIDMLKEQSRSSYPQILELLNHNIQTRDGQGVTGVQIDFTDEESQLYGVTELDLSLMPDRLQLINDLLVILNAIENDKSDNSETQ